LKNTDGEIMSKRRKELRKHFASADVAPHLKQYKPIFGYFSMAAARRWTEIALLPKNGIKTN
jgi:hypothetical protein